MATGGRDTARRRRAMACARDKFGQSSPPTLALGLDHLECSAPKPEGWGRSLAAAAQRGWRQFFGGSARSPLAEGLPLQQWEFGANGALKRSRRTDYARIQQPIDPSIGQKNATPNVAESPLNGGRARASQRNASHPRRRISARGKGNTRTNRGERNKTRSPASCHGREPD